MGFKMPTSVLKVRNEHGKVYDVLAVVAPGGGGGTNGADGVGIETIEQTVTSTEDGGENVITITLTNGATYSFTVLNGTKGSTGEKGEKGEQGIPGEPPTGGIASASGSYTGAETYSDKFFETGFRPKVLYLQEIPEYGNSTMVTVMGNYYIDLAEYNNNGSVLAVEFTDTGFIIHGGMLTDLDGQELNYSPFDSMDTNYSWVAIG